MLPELLRHIAPTENVGPLQTNFSPLENVQKGGISKGPA